MGATPVPGPVSRQLIILASRTINPCTSRADFEVGRESFLASFECNLTGISVILDSDFGIRESFFDSPDRDFSYFLIRFPGFRTQISVLETRFLTVSIRAFGLFLIRFPGFRSEISVSETRFITLQTSDFLTFLRDFPSYILRI